jgi:hypothetical protein
MLQISAHLILMLPQPVTILAASKDLNTGSAGLGTIFKANVTTLAGTGRVKPVTSPAENATS